jgi:hypothetical protein
MARIGDFKHVVKVAAYMRQGGYCAMCGAPLIPPNAAKSSGKDIAAPGRNPFDGEAHHLRPLLHGGQPTQGNCVYLCYGCHKLVGHGTAPFGIDTQGGTSRAWVKLSEDDFPFWHGKRRAKQGPQATAARRPEG